MILPNIITYPLVLLAFLIRLIFPLFFSAAFFADINIFPLNRLADYPLWFVSIVGGVFGALVGGGSLWLIGEIWKRLRGVEAMGLGDVKMMFGVGALLGWRLALLSIFIGAFTGAVVGTFIIARQNERNFQTRIPFGIFLGIGSAISLLFGEQMVNWYLDVFF
jgi:leader peptidase (prepilin peptidase)/N-methyltransferase